MTADDEFAAILRAREIRRLRKQKLGGGGAEAKPQRDGFSARDHVTRQEQPRRVFVADERREEVGGAHAGVKAELGKRQPHLGVVGVEAHVAGERDGKSCADGAAVDGGDDGHRQRAQGEEAAVEGAHGDGAADGVVAGTVLKELEVASSAEALALAGEHHGSEGGVKKKRDVTVVSN